MNNQTVFLEGANRIGLKLCRDAIWDNKQCNWVGASMEYIDNGWKTVQRSFDTDLYNGTLGIAYFLSQLYGVTKDSVLKKTALGCIENVIANKLQTHEMARIGFYTGWAGNVYILRKCSELLEEIFFEEEISFFLNGLHECDLEKGGIDILAGCAGAIPVLLKQKKNNEKHIALAEKIASYLISIAYKTDYGWSWNTLDRSSGNNINNLAGFSHGTAGIAWAFLELFAATNSNQYEQAALKAFEYEKSLFSEHHGNWPDLRNAENDLQKKVVNNYASVAWCHGAPGIGLSRLRAFEITGSEEFKTETSIAVDTTAKNISAAWASGNGNFSLCHGIGGNSDLLIEYAKHFNNNELLNAPASVALEAIKNNITNNNPWQCGLQGAGETQGLMLGLSGIGYFFLRLYDSKKIPSILIYPN